MFTLLTLLLKRLILLLKHIKKMSKILIFQRKASFQDSLQDYLQSRLMMVKKRGYIVLFGNFFLLLLFSPPILFFLFCKGTCAYYRFVYFCKKNYGNILVERGKKETNHQVNMSHQCFSVLQRYASVFDEAPMSSLQHV